MLGFCNSSVEQVATPVFSPTPGIYFSGQNVEVTTETQGAAIRYTIDGSDPSRSHGTVYSSAISVSTSLTLKAIAYKTDFLDSAVESGDYQIVEIDTRNLLVQTPFDEGSGYGLANQLAPDASNYFAIPEGAFPSSGNNPWQNGGGTFTGGQPDPDGGNRAYRITNLQDWFGQFVYPLVIGLQYTVSMSVKSATVSSQNFKFKYDWAFGPNDLATTSWTRVSRTYTDRYIDPEVVGFGWDGANPLDIFFYGLKFELGATPTTYIPADGNFRLKGDVPQWSSSGVDFNGSAIRWGAANILPRTFTAVSIYAVINWPIANAPDQPGYVPIVSIANSNEDVSQIYLSVGGGWAANSTFPAARFANTILNAIGAIVRDGLWHLLTFTYNGATLCYYVDGLLVAQLAASSLSASGNILFMSIMSGWFPGSMAYMLIYDAAHNTAKIGNQFTAITAQLDDKGISITSPIALFLAEGDSITQGTGNNPYPRIAAMSYATSQTNISAVPGSTIADVSARAAAVDALRPTDTKAILSLLIGRNDAGGTTAAQLVADIKAYCLARQSAGWTVVVCTLLPGIGGGYNAFRNAVNALLVADSSFYSVICRFDLDPIMGPDGAENDAALYSDGVHPTQLGQNYLGADFVSAVAPLFSE